ncbi:hypothetical protein AV530_010249 [Patagioenas fasciata monilis]|uniref:Uncharacterized protein n=1 Tax=Patagioenas fasciata monilis TaxID=372326 RepID=A0A1V4KCV3_PATFA|nr:hypothetical protein AV530_010249 [Patagioenas fasciata monilis]
MASQPLGRSEYSEGTCSCRGVLWLLPGGPAAEPGALLPTPDFGEAEASSPSAAHVEGKKQQVRLQVSIKNGKQVMKNCFHN